MLTTHTGRFITVVGVIDEEAARPPGLPRTFDRVAFRIGLSLWVPLES